MTISLIVAASENGIIGRDGDMPWHLSADLKRFKRLTMNHHMIMGRKTYQAIGRLLPGRTTIIVTRQQDLQVDGALIANSLTQAFEIAKNDDQIFVVGGGEIYRQALPYADKIFLTRVHTTLDGDTSFPKIDWQAWQLVHSETHASDDRNDFPVTFEDYQRLSNPQQPET